MKVKLEKSAKIFGKVRCGDGVYLARGSIIRSQFDSVLVGNSTWVLENSVLIGTKNQPLIVGAKTVFGHRCIAIGAEIGNLCEIGNGTIILPKSKIGHMCVFGEGTLIPEGSVIPDESVVIGRPYRIIRKLNDEDKAMLVRMRSNDIALKEYSENIYEFPFKGVDSMINIFPYNDKYPKISETAILMDYCEVVGDVVIGENSIVASGVRIIGNSHGPVIIGNNVQILENTVLHLLPDNQLIIEDGVTIGPGCIIHGTIIGENSIVESGSIICDYSKIGKNTIVKSGSLIKQRDVFSDNVILEGFPAKPIGNTDTLYRPDWAIK